jgi:hypothetical protein
MDGKGERAPGVERPFIIDAELNDGSPSVWLCWRSINGGRVFGLDEMEPPFG